MSRPYDFSVTVPSFNLDNGWSHREPVRRCFGVHTFAWANDHRLMDQTDILGRDRFVLPTDDDSTSLYLYAANDVALVVNGQMYDAPYKQLLHPRTGASGTLEVPGEPYAYWIANRLQEAYMAVSAVIPSLASPHPFRVENVPEHFGPSTNNTSNVGGWPSDLPRRIRAVYPMAHPVPLPFVHPTGVDFQGSPTMMLPPWTPKMQGEYAAGGQHLLGHELFHALHFHNLPLSRRQALAQTYAAWIIDKLAHLQGPYHSLETSTIPEVAFIEAWSDFMGFLIHSLLKTNLDPQTLAPLTPIVPGVTYVTTASIESFLAKNGIEKATFGNTGKGDACEGAIAMFLFSSLYDAIVAKNAAIRFPLDIIFRVMLDSQALTAQEFLAGWDRLGGATVPAAEVRAMARDWGIRA